MESGMATVPVNSWESREKLRLAGGIFLVRKISGLSVWFVGKPRLRVAKEEGSPGRSTFPIVESRKWAHARCRFSAGLSVFQRGKCNHQNPGLSIRKPGCCEEDPESGGSLAPSDSGRAPVLFGRCEDSPAGTSAGKTLSPGRHR